MKKIKIMLFSLVLLAVVGGVVAFKARFNVKYCTSTFVAGQFTPPQTCSILSPSTTVGAAPNAPIWTTTPIIVEGQLTCRKANGTYLSCCCMAYLTKD